MVIRNHYPILGALALILVVYLVSMPRVITLEDAGLSFADVDGYFCAGDAPGTWPLR